MPWLVHAYLNSPDEQQFHVGAWGAIVRLLSRENVSLIPRADREAMRANTRRRRALMMASPLVEDLYEDEDPLESAMYIASALETLSRVDSILDDAERYAADN